MPAIQVRDFSDEVYAQIKAEAKANGRSITQQTKYIVMQYLEQRQQQRSEAGNAEGAGEGESAPSEAAEASAKVRRPVQARLQAADPYVPPHGSYPNPRRVEDADVVAARVARRKAVFDRIASRNYPPSAYGIDAAQIVREMRDER